MIKRVMTVLGLFCMSLGAQAQTVALDVGHYWPKSGVMGANGEPEFVFNHRLAEALARILRARMVNVREIGFDGNAAVLTERAQAANGSDVMLSIHHDSMQQAWIDAGRTEQLKGFSVFVSGKNPAFATSQQCARLIGAAMRQAGEVPSLYHATPIKGENRPLLDRENGVHQFDNLVVLKHAQVPAVLLEIGVIVNKQEARRLSQVAVVEGLAQTLAPAVLACGQLPR